MNSDLLDVMLSQLHTFTNMSKEPTAPSSTGRSATVLPEVAGSKHLQNGTTFLTDCAAETLLFQFPTHVVVPPTRYNAAIFKSQYGYHHLV
jgi:hypothetical protein